MSDAIEREMVTIQVVYACFDEKWALNDFLDLINEGVPAEFKGSAIAQYVRGRYDEGDHFEITYERLETDAELAARAERYAGYAAESLRREREQFEALKKKFG